MARKKTESYIPFEDLRIEEENENPKYEKVKGSYEFIKKIIIRILLILILIIATAIFISKGIEFKNKNELNTVEKSQVDYQVYLKDNKHYQQKYLNKDMQYIASIIDYINIEFNYQIESDKNINGTIDYFITGKTVVYDEDDESNIIKEDKVDNKNGFNNITSLKLTNENKKEITQSIKIPYDEYNNIIRNFKNDYNLLSGSKLEVVLKVIINGTDVDEKIPVHTESNITVKIPLTEQMINISIPYNLVDSKKTFTNTDNIVVKKTDYIIISVLCLVIIVIVLINLSKLLLKTTKKSLYETKLNKILKEYDRLIAEVKNINIKDKEVTDVTSFEELIDIRDNLSIPILYKEIHKGSKAVFIIKNNDTIYRYTLKEVDLEEKK